MCPLQTNSIDILLPEWSKFDNALSNSDVHIFRAVVHKHLKELPVYENLLCKEELLKACLFFKAEDKERYTISRGILKQLLAHYLNTVPESIVIVRDINKKPIIKDFPHLHFNISHSGNCIAFAFSHSPLGIDVEFINHNLDYKPIADICFTDPEIYHIKKSSKPADEFFKLWTRKEALLKATGKGINDEMNKLNCLNGFYLSDITGSAHGSYGIDTFEVETNYVASIAYNFCARNLSFFEV